MSCVCPIVMVINRINKTTGLFIWFFSIYYLYFQWQICTGRARWCFYSQICGVISCSSIQTILFSFVLLYLPFSNAPGVGLRSVNTCQVIIFFFFKLNFGVCLFGMSDILENSALSKLHFYSVLVQHYYHSCHLLYFCCTFIWTRFYIVASVGWAWLSLFYFWLFWPNVLPVCIHFHPCYFVSFV